VNSQICFSVGKPWNTVQQGNGLEFPELLLDFLNLSYTLGLDVLLAYCSFSALVYLLLKLWWHKLCKQKNQLCLVGFNLNSTNMSNA
jgi:hypothetical protein